ncbi:MAG: tetratricopeptide repeat protein [Terracidiphilus sp.]
MLEFNPNSPFLVTELGCINYYAGRYEDSLRYYRQSLALAPHGILAAWGFARSLGKLGRYSEALAFLRKFDGTSSLKNPLLLAEIGYMQARSGDRSDALATMHHLKAMARTRFVDPYFIAVIYLGLKDRDATYAWLDKAYTIRSPFLVSIATDPKWSASQGDPRFQALWNRMLSKDHAAASVPTKSSL